MISTRARLAIALLLLLAAGVTFVPVAAAQTLDWNSWRRLPVLDSGRPKPFETLAREKLRAASGHLRTVDPETGECLDACALYLGMLFDWYGWDRVGPSAGSNGHGSRYIPHPDKWDRMPLLRVDFPPLRSVLGLKPEQEHISPLELSQSKMRLPDNGEDTPLLTWTATLASREQEELTPLERQALDLAGKFRAYQDWRAGRHLMVVPQPVKTDPTNMDQANMDQANMDQANMDQANMDQANMDQANMDQANMDQAWLSVSEIVGGKWDDTSDATGDLRSLQKQFREARTAYLQGSVAEFRQASAVMLQTAVRCGPRWGVYPAAAKINWEIAYNHWAPFRCAWMLMLCATVTLTLAVRTKRKNLYRAGRLAFAAGWLAVLVGFGMRAVITSRAPVSNMYESVILAALGVALLGFICELIYRRKSVLTVAAAIATLALVLADSFPGVLDPSLQPLQPVLHSNFWLVAHVLTITLSFAALSLAWGMGNVTLGYFLAAADDSLLVETLTQVTHRCLSVGVLLLVAGTILGTAWADRAWGRFWGWDPKEVWTLIALLAYLAVLRACATGWLGRFALAACSVSCYALVVMAWYGVNYVLGVGLHSYGFGTGGQKFVLLALAAQLLYVAIATVRYYRSCALVKRRRGYAGNMSGCAPSPLMPSV